MSPDRGQLGFDFVAGMSLFLITVGFVFNFAPVMFDPFTTGQGGDMMTADRTAATIAEDLLVENETGPNVLDTDCTEEFFDADGATADCGFAQDADDLNSAIGVDNTIRVNVTVENNGSAVVLNGVTLAAGPPPSAAASTTISQRIVFLDGSERTLNVRVW